LGQLRNLVKAEEMIDPWGSELLYEPVTTTSGERYIVASLGADRRLDVADLKDYLKIAHHHVGGSPDRDIVLVDGEFVASAGK
jgi:hypothetical protein